MSFLTLLVLVTLCVVVQSTAIGYAGYTGYGYHPLGYPAAVSPYNAVGYHGYHPYPYHPLAAAPAYANGAQNPLVPASQYTCTEWWCPRGHPVLPLAHAVSPAVALLSKKREAEKQRRSLGESNQAESEEVSRERKQIYNYMPATSVVAPATYPHTYPYGAAAYHPYGAAAYHPYGAAAYHPYGAAAFHPAVGASVVPAVTCPQGQYLPGANAFTFYQCTHGVPVLKSCGPNQVWNQAQLTCVNALVHTLLPNTVVASKKREAEETKP